jgi:hypothetical protein
LKSRKKKKKKIVLLEGQIEKKNQLKMIKKKPSQPTKPVARVMG